MQPLHQLVYLSTASQSFPETSIQKILRVSRQRNKRDGITGLMLYPDRSFLQVLEGPRRAVDACYDRISKDPRHYQLSVMCSKDIGSRVFGDWEMASLPFDEATAEAQEGFLNTRDLQDSETMRRAQADPISKSFLNTFLLSLR